MTISPGWAIELQGDKLDLDDFEVELARPHTPWVERDGEVLLLRSTTWIGLHDSRAVMEEGRRLIAQLNGAARLIHDDAREVRLGTLRRFNDNGQPLPISLAATLNVTLDDLRVRFRAAVSLEPHGVSGPSHMQQAIASAENDKSTIRADLLHSIARSNNWFDLYQVMELTEAIMEGLHELEKKLSAQKLNSDFNVWKTVRATANHYRHAPPKANPMPSNPPATPNEGLNRILPTIRRVVRGEL